MQFRTSRLLYDVRQALFAAHLAWDRRARLHDEVSNGVTIVAVTWNTLAHLQILHQAVAAHTDPSVRLLVVDNNSGDGTHEFLVSHPEIQRLALNRNWGHGLALDAGIHAARTRFVVTLDVDAFPISNKWVEAVIEPLRQGHTLAGAFSSGYIHPCFMAIERRHFLQDKHTFAASYSRRLRLPRCGYPESWDAGKLITVRDHGLHFHIEATSVRGPGALGTVFGDIVYHHFYSTRLTGVLPGDVIRSGVTPEISHQAWIEAVERYLPPQSP